MSHQPTESSSSEIAIIVIGRNEGPRLSLCLNSVSAISKNIVYVDSGSTDGSPALAAARGIKVIELDTSRRMSAARARNEGVAALCKAMPALQYIQFVDGDCEINADWIRSASVFLDKNPRVAGVAGILREKHPEASIYNKLCDIEWRREPGESDSFGGIVLIRLTAFLETGGFRDDLIAGEEPELSSRLRRSAWKIWRLPVPMATHDAAILSFGQWFKRCRRVGFGYANALFTYSLSNERLHTLRLVSRPVIWILAVPAIAMMFNMENLHWSITVLLIYAIRMLQLRFFTFRNGPIPWFQAMFSLAGKLPELVGLSDYAIEMLTGAKRTAAYDYKLFSSDDK